MPAVFTKTHRAPVKISPLSDWTDSRRLLCGLLAFAVVRLAFAFTFDAVPQEAYYFLYSQHLALSYFDHPPVLALLLRGFTELLGPHVFALRLTAFCVTALTQVAFLLLARRCLPRARATSATLLLCGTGAFTLLSLISLPDVPLMLFWTLSLLHLHRALFDPKLRSGWLLAGVFMGLAFDSKYTGIFLQAGLVLFLLCSKAHRPLLKTVWPYATLLIAQGVMFPVYLWNWQHGFASFAFQSVNRASGAHGLHLRYLAGLLASQGALLLPPLFLVVGYGLVRRTRAVSAPRRDPQALFLWSFCAPLFALMLVVSLFSLVKANWLFPVYVTGTLLAAPLFSPRLLRLQWGSVALLHLLAAVELLVYPVPITSSDTWMGWRALGEEVSALSSRHPGAFLFSADSYKTAAELRLYTGIPVLAGNVLGLPALQFDYLGDNLPGLRGHEALDIEPAPPPWDGRRRGEVPAGVLSRFEHVEELAPLLIRAHGETVRKFYVYSARGYRGPFSNQ